MATGPATHMYSYDRQANGGTGGVSGRNQILRFQSEVPQTLTLTTTPDTAQQVQGNFGPQWLYFCEESKMFYADQGLHAALQTAAAEGKLAHSVEITKRKIGNRVSWRFYAGTEVPEEPPQPTAAPRNPQEAQAAKSASQSAESARLLHLYLQSIELAAHAKQYAASRGLLIEPSFEDLRCIAATLFIQERGK